MAAGRRKFLRELEFRWTPNPATGAAAIFLWGPRQTGKPTLLHDRFPAARFYDLLDTVLAAELSLRPRLLREQVLAERPEVVVIDEVQKVPDLLVGDLELALELKSATTVRATDLRGLRALAEEYTVRRRIVVARESRPRMTDDGIEIMPWRAFCQRLWSGDLI